MSNSEQLDGPTPTVRLQPERVERAAETFEKALKFAISLVGIVTALGVPAVVLHYSRHSVPIQFVSSGTAFRAGILPATLFALSFLYVYRTSRRLNQRRDSDEMPPSLAVATGCAGLLALGVFVMLTSGPFVWLWDWLGHVLGLDPNPRSLYQRLLLFAIIPVWIVTVVLTILLLRLIRVLPSVDTIGEALQNWPNERPIFLVVILVLTISTLAALSMYELQWLLAIMEPEIARRYDPGRVILPIVVSGPFLGSVVALQLAAGHPDPLEPGRGRVLLILAALLLYIPVTAVYSSEIYPRTPYMFGGGRLVRMVLWIEPKALPPAIGAACTQATDVEVKCDQLYVMNVDSDFIILLAKDEWLEPAVIVPARVIRAISGAQGRPASATGQ